MADFSTLIATLQATIKTNYNQEITGQILQDDLLAMVNTINQLKQDTLEGYGFYGAPLADGASVNVTQNTFFLVGPGTYTINGEANTIAGAGVSVLVYDSVNDEVRVYSLFSYDTTPTADSKNAITSGAVHTALAAKQDKDTDAVAGNVAVMDASGNSEDGGVPLAGLATKAEVAVVAGEAGLAEAVIDTDGAGTEQEFTFRKSGGDGGAYYRKIKGKTIAWNQLAIAAAADFRYDRDTERTRSINIGLIPSGHKVLLAFVIKNAVQSTSGENSFGIEYRSQQAFVPIEDGKTAMIVTFDDDRTSIYTFINMACSSGTAFTMQGFVATDLTLMFGAGNEPTTVAEFEALYPGYHEYNPGILKSNDADAVETTGVNQWDGQKEDGKIMAANNGNLIEDPTSFVTRYIPVITGETYYFSSCFAVGSGIFGICFYDSEKNYISGSIVTEGFAFTRTIPAGIAFMRVSGTLEYANTGIINLSNPAINGQYFPFWKRTLQLGITTREDTDGNVPFPNGLQSCPVAQDEATKEGGIIRIGTRAYQAGDESDANVITDGTNTNYALTTPQTFTWAEPLNLGVKVDENGTERAVAPEGATAPSAPFVADTTYTMSVARMVEKLQNL